MKNYENLKDTLSFYNIDCDNSFYISTGESIFKFPENPFRMDYYAFCICTRGEIDLEINTIKYKISVGSIICSSPSTIVHFLNDTNDFHMQLVFFKKNFLLSNISDPFIIEKMELFQNDSYSIINTSKKNTEVLLDIIDKLKDKEKKIGEFTKQIIRTLIFHLLLEIAEIYHNVAPDTIESKDLQKNFYFKFKKLVQENILLQKSVQFYANQLCISNKYLIEITKCTIGKTPHQIINEAILKEAIVLLGNPDLSISEVAYKLRFNSVSAFGRFFKRQTTFSPSEHRSGKK